jgi:ankyrin repeat protein
MSEDLTKELVLAAEAGELDKVKEALEKGASPSAMGPNSGALHCAAFNGHKEVVDFLLKKGSDTSLKDNQSFYPLHLAASKGHAAICNALIKVGANLEVTTSRGGTALHVAAASNFGKVVSALVTAGANIEARDEHGSTPISTASQLGHNSIVKALIKAGADINSKEITGDTSVIKALRNMYNSRLKSWSSIGSNDGKEVKYEVIKGCFRYDSNYEATNKNKLGNILTLKDQRYYASQSWGPVAHLDYLNALDTVKTLIKADADLGVNNDSGQTAMSMACHTGEAKMIEELHKKGASFYSKTESGATPLHQVAGSGRFDGLEMFFSLVKDSNTNQVDEYGWTALHYLADIGGHIKMAVLLLEKGADITIKSTKDRGKGTPEGVTPSEVALRWKDNEMADALK